MLKQLQNKAAEGFETVWLHIEDSTDYETNTFNVQELLELFDDNEKEYKGLYVENGNMYSGSGMCNVFIDEEECIIFCTNYLCCLLYTSPSPRDGLLSRMPSSA